MPPKESSPLLPEGSRYSTHKNGLTSQSSAAEQENVRKKQEPLKRQNFLLLVGGILLVALVFSFFGNSASHTLRKQTGPYRLVELQEGKKFFDHYEFLDGPDSIGSAGYNEYVGKSRAEHLDLANVTREKETDYIYLQSIAGSGGSGFRKSVRLEGKRRFNRGLFVLDVAHMPSGCGVWPAFWLTDEDAWPDNGEIDIVEGINTQSVAKTALHTSESCSMYAHVPTYAKTGGWDTASGIPNTYTGIPDYETHVEADNCWVMAPHQWGNQGCVAVSAENGTIGEPMNAVGGGVYVLEWDPANGYIKSWVFKRGHIPLNLRDSIRTASSSIPVLPQPDTWDLPYAYFAIGEGSGCSLNHFKNMRLIFNLAFCGAVAGNRFFRDCPTLSAQWNVKNDSVLTCNAYLDSEPAALSEAYWKIRGVYVYQRDWQRMGNKTKDSQPSTEDDDQEGR